nr:gliding motility-associated C-terminal domain-containing protein [Saprospiraceae bacterium]
GIFYQSLDTLRCGAVRKYVADTNIQGPDDDMDGIVDECDRCPDFDDRIDSNGDGFPDGCEPNTFIPTGFSPNGDGINDYFSVAHESTIRGFRLYIIDRFGGLIYESDSNAPGWDGTVNGQLADQGVYGYVVELDGKRRTGTVTLLR